MAAFLEDRSRSNKLPVPVQQYFRWTGDQTTRCVVTFTLYTSGKAPSCGYVTYTPQKCREMTAMLLLLPLRDQLRKKTLKFC